MRLIFLDLIVRVDKVSLISFVTAYGISLTYRDLTPSDSALAIIMGMNIIMFLPVIWLNFFLNAKTDSYKNLNFQGVPNALAMMMLIWIISFTAAHEEDEKLLAKALIEPIVKLATGEEMRDGSVTMEESEF